MMKTFTFFAFAPVLACAALMSSCALAQPVANQQDVPWQKVPILPPEAAKSGITPGGEGGQWFRDLQISQSNPNFMLLGIDVGGLYRSTDGGANWTQATEGWHARGANSLAIDPRNENHVLGVAGNSMDYGANWGPSPHGVYLSNDGALSWTHVLARLEGNGAAHDARPGGIVAFDPSSYDAQQKICTRAYFLARSPGLFRTDDGGKSWRQVHRDVGAGKMEVGADGTIFVGNPEMGLMRSTDKGKTFEKLGYDGLHGLDLVRGQVFVSGSFGIQTSRDNGVTWTKLSTQGIEGAEQHPVQNIMVSPADANHMGCWVALGGWNWVRYVSQNGGRSWSPIKVLGGTARRQTSDTNAAKGGLATLPLNVRQGYYVWHPTDKNVVYGWGGDWTTRSTDGGKTFEWHNNGNNGIMVGSHFNFSKHDPNTVFLAFQDYNGAFTTDAGKTWNYRDVSGHGWGGHAYGGHAVDKQVMWYGDSENWGPPRRTRISRDGGTTWVDAKGPDGKACLWTGAEVSYSDPKNPNTLFASNWRSTDKGETWAQMADCDGVFISAPDNTLIGKKGDAIVTSKDGGASWGTVVQVPGDFRDVAFDHTRNRYYAVSHERVKMWEGGDWQTLETPRNQYGGVRVDTVAVDPQNPDVVYCGGPNNIFSSGATAARSTDAGKTWMNLTTGSGAHEVSAIRVHPVTRDAWFAGQCYGMWKLAAPTTLGATPEQLRDAPRAVSPPAPQMLPARAGDIRMIRDFGDPGFDYDFGDASWRNGQSLTVGRDGDIGFVQIDATEHGGAGAVGAGNIVDGGQTHLAVRLRALPGNAAGRLNVNVIPEGRDGVAHTFDLSGLKENEWTTLQLPLGNGDFANVAQLQFAGVNWSGGAQPLKLQIDWVGTLLSDTP